MVAARSAAEEQLKTAADFAWDARWQIAWDIWRWRGDNFGHLALAQMDFLCSRRFVAAAFNEILDPNCAIPRNQPTKLKRVSLRFYFCIPLADRKRSGAHGQGRRIVSTDCTALFKGAHYRRAAGTRKVAGCGASTSGRTRACRRRDGGL
jgi:hypothetical protein